MFAGFALVLLLIVLFAFAITVFQWLWNTTMPQVFGVRMITFWQSCQLLLIAGFLFGGVHMASQNSSNKDSGVEAKLDKIIEKLEALKQRLPEKPLHPGKSLH